MIGVQQGEKSGLATAAAELHDPNQPPVMPAEQLPLLPIREVGREIAAEPDDLPRGVGRPKGSKNKSTEEWKQYILGHYRSPLIAMAEIYSRSIKDLAIELGWNPDDKLSFDKAKEILQMQLQCAKELAPYVHQKQPLAVEGKGDGLMTLVIGAMPNQQLAEENTPIFGGDFVDITPTKNQQLGDENGAKSNETQLNESANTEEISGESHVSTANLETDTKGGEA